MGDESRPQSPETQAWVLGEEQRQTPPQPLTSGGVSPPGCLSFPGCLSPLGCLSPPASTKAPLAQRLEAPPRPRVLPSWGEATSPSSAPWAALPPSCSRSAPAASGGGRVLCPGAFVELWGHVLSFLRIPRSEMPAWGCRGSTRGEAGARPAETRRQGPTLSEPQDPAALWATSSQPRKQQK